MGDYVRGATATVLGYLMDHFFVGRNNKEALVGSKFVLV